MPKHLGKSNFPLSSSAPSSPFDGQVYHNSSDNHAYVYRAGSINAWVQLDNTVTGGIIQSAFANITTDVSTTSSTFVNVLSTTLTTAGNKMKFQLTFSATNSTGNKNIGFQILLDGAVQRGGGINISNAGSAISGAVSHETATAVAAGTHTVAVQWSTSGGTAQINASSSPATNHLSLFVDEVT
jgi:hypothetical protein